MDTPDDDVASLLDLADRLDAARRPFVAAAARQAAFAARDGRDVPTAALRRQAIEIALRLDVVGLPSEAHAVFSEVVRRARAEPEAMPDSMFRAWLDAIAAQFPEAGPLHREA